MSKMIPDLEKHFRDLIPASRGMAARLEDEADRNGYPIVGPLVGRLLTLLTRAVGAGRVLELGTHSGYSALFLAAGLSPGGRVISLERDPERAERARDNLAQAGLAEKVQVLSGSADELLAGLEPGFDLAFLDIDKAAYAPALAPLGRLLRPGGLLVADNTGFADAVPFNQTLAGDPAWLETALLCRLPGHSPELDGLSLAVRL